MRHTRRTNKGVIAAEVENEDVKKKWEKKKKENQNALCPLHQILESFMVDIQWKPEGNKRRHIKVRRATNISTVPSWHFRAATPSILPGWGYCQVQLSLKPKPFGS